MEIETPKKCKCGKDALFTEYIERSIKITDEYHSNPLLDYTLARMKTQCNYLCYSCAKKLGWFGDVHLTNYGKAKLPLIHNEVIEKVKERNKYLKAIS